MKYSIKKQFAGVFCLLMIGTIVLCWFINSTFLEKYYLSNKQNALMNAYRYMNAASNEEKINTEEFDIEIQKICGKNNISFILLDAETQTLKTSTNDYEFLSRKLLNNLFEKDRSPYEQILVEEQNYTICIAMDERIKTDYVEMWGVLDNGNLFLFRSPLESIKDSVKLANRFLAYVGLCAAFMSALIGLWVSGKITKPIKELTQISEKMIHLDFDAKYSGKAEPK